MSDEDFSFSISPESENCEWQGKNRSFLFHSTIYIYILNIQRHTASDQRPRLDSNRFLWNMSIISLHFLLNKSRRLIFFKELQEWKVKWYRIRRNLRIQSSSESSIEREERQRVWEVYRCEKISSIQNKWNFTLVVIN